MAAAVTTALAAPLACSFRPPLRPLGSLARPIVSGHLRRLLAPLSRKAVICAAQAFHARDLPDGFVLYNFPGDDDDASEETGAIAEKEAVDADKAEAKADEEEVNAKKKEVIAEAKAEKEEMNSQEKDVNCEKEKVEDDKEEANAAPLADEESEQESVEGLRLWAGPAAGSVSLLLAAGPGEQEDGEDVQCAGSPRRVIRASHFFKRSPVKAMRARSLAKEEEAEKEGFHATAVQAPEVRVPAPAIPRPPSKFSKRSPVVESTIRAFQLSRPMKRTNRNQLHVVKRIRLQGKFVKRSPVAARKARQSSAKLKLVAPAGGVEGQAPCASPCVLPFRPASSFIKRSPVSDCMQWQTRRDHEAPGRSFLLSSRPPPSASAPSTVSVDAGRVSAEMCARRVSRSPAGKLLPSVAISTRATRWQGKSHYVNAAEAMQGAASAESSNVEAEGAASEVSEIRSGARSASRRAARKRMLQKVASKDPEGARTAHASVSSEVGTRSGARLVRPPSRFHKHSPVAAARLREAVKKDTGIPLESWGAMTRRARGSHEQGQGSVPQGEDERDAHLLGGQVRVPKRHVSMFRKASPVAASMRRMAKLPNGRWLQHEPKTVGYTGPSSLVAGVVEPVVEKPVARPSLVLPLRLPSSFSKRSPVAASQSSAQYRGRSLCIVALPAGLPEEHIASMPDERAMVIGEPGLAVEGVDAEVDGGDGRPIPARRPSKFKKKRRSLPEMSRGVPASQVTLKREPNGTLVRNRLPLPATCLSPALMEGWGEADSAADGFPLPDSSVTPSKDSSEGATTEATAPAVGARIEDPLQGKQDKGKRWTEEELASMTVVNLRKTAKDAGLSGYSKYPKKAQLVRFLLESLE